MKFCFFYIILTLLIVSVFCCTNRNKNEEAQSQRSIKDKSKDNNRHVDKLRARTLGLAYLEENKLEEAEIEFEKVVELAPDESLGYANLGIVYLRMGKYEEAKKQLLTAKQLSPEDPDIRLNLSKVYELTGEKEKSIEELKKSVEIAPDHVRSLYSLAETYSGSSDIISMAEWENYLHQIVEAAPTNIVSKLYLTELLLKKKDLDGAIKQLEELSQLFPDFPVEAREYYENTLTQLHSNKIKDGLTSFFIFHNFLKLTKSYQSGIQNLKGNTGATVGYPVMSFSKSTTLSMSEDGSILGSIRFTETTKSSWLETDGSNSEFSSLALGDIDSDGDIDIFYTSGKSQYLFQNEFGRFENILNSSNLDIEGNVKHSTFADFNNDGHLDLLLCKENGVQLFTNVNEGEFQDVSSEAFTDHENITASAGLFVDADHDGDLDIFFIGPGESLYRNNGDGTFINVTNSAGFGRNAEKSKDAGIGDFDDDGDIDVFVVRDDGNNTLYSNMRQGKFDDVTSEKGLQAMSSSGAVAIGDYNNDGFLDMFITSMDGSAYRLYSNKGDGTYEEDHTSSGVFDILKSVKGHDATFIDFDNDGRLDILVVGETSITGKTGVFLFHNNGEGNFKDESRLLPQELLGGKEVALADYNEDGDLDLYVVDLEGKLRLIRNDGGNGNHHLKMQLVGMRTGSGKNNHFGIGAKVEVRAGDLYQMQVVSSPNIHFGMGDRSKADVVRILWTNGVPQNIFSPGSDEDLIEAQELKGSCPFLYTWNGKEFVFVKDMMWRSALGMPLGIMGGKTAFAFADASEEYLKIPGELLHEKDGKFTIQMTEELWETIYTDEIKLIAVDHPEEIEIYVDEKFVAPPYPELKVFKVKNHRIPKSANDGNGTNLLDIISKKDHTYISNFQREHFQGVTKMKDLILDLGQIRDTKDLHLFLNGWIFPTDASINVALSQSDVLKIKQPSLEVINANGDWEEVIASIGFPSGKNKTVIVDLSDKFLSSQRKVRIRTNMEIYWDYIFFAKDAEVDIEMIEMNPETADYHYRGFSAKFRKGGRNGPHWFDYNEVTTGQKWRDLTGKYTRYGDVTELLQLADNMYIIANAGDETTISFNASTLPKLHKGWKRDFLIYSVGWVKDGDLNTALGQTVEPLPFHGMRQYPYGPDEHYPTTKQHQEYQRRYNTREVGTEKFREYISNSNE